MTLRDDLLPVVDSLRDLPNQFGLRRYTVTLRSRTWPGGAPGLGTPVSVDTVITPPPKVRSLSPKEIADSGGAYLDGDFMVEKITPSYVSPTTGGWSPAVLHQHPGSLAQDCLIVLMGDEGMVECEPVKFWWDRPFNYRVVVRAKRAAAG